MNSQETDIINNINLSKSIIKLLDKKDDLLDIKIISKKDCCIDICLLINSYIENKNKTINKLDKEILNTNSISNHTITDAISGALSNYNHNAKELRYKLNLKIKQANLLKEQLSNKNCRC